MSQLTTKASACVTFRTAFPCDLSRVSAARLAVKRFLEEQSVRREEASACELALAEACNNAIQNATPEGLKRPVELLVLCTTSKIELHVRPAEVLARINELLFDDLSVVNMFITVQMLLLDSRQRRGVIGNAGHCPLLLANGRSQTIQTVAPEGMPLGIMRDAAFDEAVISLEPDCRLLLYTDGLTDSRNAAGEPFGQQRLEQWLAARVDRPNSAAALKEGLIAALKDFESTSPLRDDRTFLIAANED